VGIGKYESLGKAAGILANALNLLGVDVYYQSFITGLILILAVIFDVLNEHRKASGS